MENNNEFTELKADELEKKTNLRKDFKNEKEFCNFLEDNLKLISKEFFNEKLEEYKREFYLRGYKQFGGNMCRVDFYLKFKSGKTIVIEVKNPKSVFSELTRSIGQVLSYIIEAKKHETKIDEYYIFTTKINYHFLEIIKEFKLPIKIFVIGKDFYAKLK